MHYTFDIINCMLFTAIVFILRAQRWQFSKRHRAIYALVIIDFLYLIGAVYFAFSWHARTGLTTLQPFFEFDTLYFATLGVTLGFMMLYFADICLGRVKHPLLIFPIPVAMSLIFLFVNPQTGWMFSYVDGVYQRGPLLILNYIVWFAYMATMVVMVYRARVRLGSKTLAGLLLFFAYEAGLQVFQFVVVDFYIGGIAFTSGLLYLVIAPLFLEPARSELTGLYNRQSFMRIVKDLLNFDTRTEYYLIAVDINGFRDINERFGFQVGNRVLAYTGKLLTRLYPDAEALSHFNSDKFFICCPKDKAILSLPDIPIEECAPEVREPYMVSLCQGIYPIVERDIDVSLMCDRAAFALQQVKGDYHRNYAFFDVEAQDRLQFRSYILQEMPNALSNGSFVVFCQPVVDIQDGAIKGAEALVRWKDEKYGMISPGDFIPLFEENGSIGELDLYVCKEVCACIARRKAAGLPTVPVSVNLSRVGLLTQGFIDDFIDIVRQSGVSSDDIRIEITESAFVHAEEISEQIEKARGAGFSILMDDFGSGYSNFNTFAIMPVDILKVDMGFMANLDSSERGQRVFSSIIDMARKLSMPIIVEGVEEKSQVESLQALGVHFVQGYSYARPMPMQDYEAMLDAGGGVAIPAELQGSA